MRKNFLTAAIFSAVLFLTAGTVSAQDSDWFYGKPIKSVHFTNLSNIKSVDLEGVTSSFIGKTFSDDVVSAMYDKIFALEYFDDVEIKVASGNSDSKSIRVIISVVEKPVISRLNFVGNRLIHDAEIKDKISLKAKDIFSESKLMSDERAIRNYYIEKGFSKAKVSSSYETAEDGSVVVSFKISEGRQLVVKDILFEGNKLVSSKTLRGKMSLKKAGVFNKGEFQGSAINTDSKAIVLYYMNRGYADARVLNVRQETAFNEKRGREEVTLIYEIQEGAQYTFGGVSFTGNQIFKTEELSALVKLQEGAVYNETKFQESRGAIQDLYYNNGYTSNRFSADAQKNTDSRVISYVITIEERSRSHVENILIKGNEKTKDYVIRREIPITEGDVFSNAKIHNGLRSLYNLQFFSAVTPEVVPGSEEGLIDLVFTVEEQSTTSLDFGFTFSGVSSPNDFPLALYAKIQESNFMGMGLTCAASTTLSTDEQSVGLSYGQSWTFDMPISTSFSVNYSHAKRYSLRNKILLSGDLDDDYYYMEYEQHEFGLSASVGRRWTPDFAILTWAGGLSTSVISNIYNKDLYIPYDSGVTLYSGGFMPKNSIWTSFSMDGRDVSFDPSKGWFGSQKLSWFGIMPEGILPWDSSWGETEFYARTDTKLEKYFTLFDWQVTDNYKLKLVLMGMTNFSFQLAAPGTSIRQYNQLYIDGMFQGRGWQVYNSAAGRGQALWTNTIELRLPVVPGILAVDGFFDACAVKSKPHEFFSSMSFDNWYFSFGPSLRFCIQQFPLRLLFCNTFKVQNGSIAWLDQKAKTEHEWYSNWHFVLSFNVTNR